MVDRRVYTANVGGSIPSSRTEPLMVIEDTSWGYLSHGRIKAIQRHCSCNHLADDARLSIVIGGIETRQGRNDFIP